MSDSRQIKLLYDGACPLCAREIRFLERRDAGRGRIQFEDIADPAFDPTEYGLEMRDLMARIHAILPNGTVLEGLEVFRQVYTAVGLGWLLAPTRWPGLRRVADLGYRIFAANRLRLTGRAAACDTERCRAIETRPEAGPAVEATPSRAGR